MPPSYIIINAILSYDCYYIECSSTSEITPHHRPYPSRVSVTIVGGNHAEIKGRVLLSWTIRYCIVVAIIREFNWENRMRIRYSQSRYACFNYSLLNCTLYLTIPSNRFLNHLIVSVWLILCEWPILDLHRRRLATRSPGRVLQRHWLDPDHSR